MEDESLWKKLTRLFRSGPVVRHKIAGGERLIEPQGTASAFKKEISSLYVRALASYANYERLSRYSDYCLTGDTMVATNLEQGAVSIKDLVKMVEDGDEVSVFAYDHENDRVVASPITAAFSTGTRNIWEVTLDNGFVIKCTGNHPFMLRDGSYRRADELTSDTALMPFHWKEFNSYRSIYGFSNGWRAEHLVVVETEAGIRFTGDDHIHHRNFKRHDNRRTNLEPMPAEFHRAYHQRINNERFEDPMEREKQAAIARRRWSPGGDLRTSQENGTLLSEEGREAHRQWMVAYNKEHKPGRGNAGRDDQRGLDNGNADKTLTFQMICDVYKPGVQLVEICSKLNVSRFKVRKRLKWAGYKDFSDFEEKYTNHKVVSVRQTERFDEVFDLTVEKYHNFAIASSTLQGLVFVHNSEMEYTPELASALDIFADEATVKSDSGDVITVSSPNAEIKEQLETLFFDIINLNFNAWSWMRHFVKFGDFVLFIDANPENGILNLVPIPINEIEREEGFDPNDPMAVRFRWMTRGNMIIENWQIIHFRLLGNDAFLPYGQSVLEPARRIWRQLILIEDAMLVYRIVRSPERRVFHIEIANTPPEQVDAFIEQVKTQMKRSTVVDPESGRVDLRYNPLPVRQNTLIPLLDGRTLTIEEVAREHEDGKQNWTYSMLEDGSKRIVPGRIDWAGKNYTCDRLHRVWLDDGSYIDTAPEHPFVMRDGTSKRADELVGGESLMAIYCGLNKGYERFNEPCGKQVSTHVMVARDAHKKIWEATSEHIVHHKMDLGPPDKRNNNPDRIEVMNFWKHRKMHQEHINLTMNRPEQLAIRAVRLIEQNKTPEFIAGTVERNLRMNLGPKMGAVYNGTELHKSHNEIRRKAQKQSWESDKVSRSDAMRWIIPNETMERVFDIVRANPTISKYKLTDAIRADQVIIDAVKVANTHNNRKVEKFHYTAVKSKLERMGELPVECGYPEFRAYLATRPVPLNHQVVRVDVIQGESDDVYCMTIRGSNGEEDRHNFGVTTLQDMSNGLKSLVFIKNSVEEDYFLPKRGEQKSQIDTLAGGQFTGDIEDVQYIQSKMFAAIKIPRAYLGYEDQLGSKATLAQEDVRFARTTGRIQSLFVSELNKIAIVHLYLLGFRGDDLVNFELDMACPSTIAEQQRLELWRIKLEVAGMAQEGVFNRDFVYERIFGLNPKQIAQIKEGKRLDKLEDTLLQSIEAPTPPPTEGGAGEAPPPGPEPAPPAPGAEELPDTLGGEPGGEAPPPPAGPENAGVSRLGGLLGEKKNMGSTGDDSQISVARGKNLFSTGEKQSELAFGTKKQTASDPYDQRAARRMITRPFSEETEEPPMLAAEQQIDELEEQLDLLGEWLERN